MSRLLLVHENCEIIANTLKKELKSNGLEINELVLKNRLIHDLYLIMKRMGRVDNELVLICHPIDHTLLAKVFILLISKPRKIVFIIPPSPIHKRDSVFGKITLYVLRTLLTTMKLIGIKFLFVFTTPYERLLVDEIIHGIRYVFYPTYTIEKPSFRELMFSEKPVISFFVLEKDDIERIKETLDILEELGFKPFIVLGLMNINLNTCIDDYRVLCMNTDSLDDLIRYSTIVVVKTPTPETNNVILKSILYYKPVITTLEHGLALYYNYTGLVYIREKWDSESLANAIIEVLNNMDEIKKKSLSVLIFDLKRDYGRHIITRFLKN